jgi:hypothetical protein
MTDDLVKRLREGDEFERFMLAERAADRIEELEAKLAEKDGELGLLRAHIHRLGYAGSQFEALLLPRGVEGPDYRLLHTETARKWRKAYDKAIGAALKGEAA